MKKLIFLLFTLPIFTFGQNLNDFVNFDSLNKELIINELIDLVIKKRQNIVPIEKDTVPMCASKYHVLYFETYGDESQIHHDEKPVYTDLYNKGYLVGSICSYPEDRIFFLEEYIKYPDYGLVPDYMLEHVFVSENSFFYNFKKDSKIRYRELVQLVLDDFLQYSSQGTNKLFDNLTNEKKYLGVSCGKFDKGNNDVTFTSTYVLTKKKNN